MPKEICDHNHLILYAKHHYKRGDLMVDLKRIVAERCALDLTCVSDDDVWQNVVMCLLKHAKPHEVELFLGRMFQKGCYDYQSGNGVPIEFGVDDKCPIRRAIRMALGILSNIPVLDKGVAILDLGEPDPDLLPLNR